MGIQLAGWGFNSGRILLWRRLYRVFRVFSWLAGYPVMLFSIGWGCIFPISILNPSGNREKESEVSVPFFYFLFPNMDFGNREIEGGLYLGIPNSYLGQM